MSFQPLNAFELIRDFNAAHCLIDGIFKRFAAIRRSAIVDRKDNPALIHQILLQRPAAPACHHLTTRTWPTIDLQEYRIALSGLHLRKEELGVQRGAICGFDRAKFGRGVARNKRRVGMLGIELILFDPRQALAFRIGQIDALRLARVGLRDNRAIGGAVHRNCIPAASFC